MSFGTLRMRMGATRDPIAIQARLFLECWLALPPIRKRV